MRVQTELNLQTTAPGRESTIAHSRMAPSPSTTYAAVAKAMPSVPPADSTYQVVPGDNLTVIVRQYLMERGGNPSVGQVYEGVRAVASANHLQNPDLIFPGQVLELSALTHDGAHNSPGAALADLPLALVPDSVQQLLDATPQAVQPAVPAAIPEAPRDDILHDATLPGPAAPVRVSANAAAALLPPVKAVDTADPVPALPRQEATGGDGPVPSEAAVALQRILNSTANAITLLRDLVDPPNPTKASGPWQSVLGANARLTSEFGMRMDPFTGRRGLHDGIDLAAKRGTEITAFQDGEVTFSGWKGGYGNTVIVRHDNGLESLYAHTARTHVREGDRVQAGAVLADVGSTGRSTGPHLHLEVRRDGRAVDPRPYLEDSLTSITP